MPFSTMLLADYITYRLAAAAADAHAQALVVEAGHGDDQAAARRHQPRVPRGHRPGRVGIQEMQDRAEDDAHRPGRVGFVKRIHLHVCIAHADP